MEVQVDLIKKESSTNLFVQAVEAMMTSLLRLVHGQGHCMETILIKQATVTTELLN